MSNLLQKRGHMFTKKSKQHLEKNFIERISHVRSVRLLIVEWSLLVLLIIASAIIQAFWYKNTYSFSAYVSGGTYIEGTLGRVDSINPLLASTNSEKTLARLLYLGLTAPDYSGHVGNVLADSVRATNDGKVWAVTLKKNLKWSDGVPLTNADVIFTSNLIKSSSVATSYSSNLSGVTVSENEAGELIFTLSNVYADFDSALNFPILPKHIFENQESVADFDFTSAAFSGPFALRAIQAVGAEGEAMFYLRANSYYYNTKPLISNFTVHAFLDTASILAAINSNTITGTAELPPTDASSIISTNVYEKDTSVNSGVYAFLNTTNTSVLKSRALRRAIRKGISVAELRSVVGDELPLDYPILSTQVALASWPELPTYDAEAAKDDLARLGVAPKSTSLNIVTIANGYLPSLAEDLSEQLQDLGFTTEVNIYEPTQEFLVNIVSTRAYDILLYEINLGADPDLFAYYHSSQAVSSGLNLSGYSNPLADDAILSARETLNPTVRNELYRTFVQYWVDDAPAIGIYQANIAYFYNKNTRNFSENNTLISAIDRFTDVRFWATEKSTKNRTP